jgi:hypothetical protein
MNRLAPAEGRKTGLKNNTTPLSPAPDQAIRDCQLKSRLAGYHPVLAYRDSVVQMRLT